MMMTGQLVVYCSVAAALLRGGPRIAKAPRRRARAKAGAALSADGDAHAITVVDAAAIVGGSAVGGGFLAVPAIARDVGLRPAALGLTGAWAFFALAALGYVEAAGGAMAAGPLEGEDAAASIRAVSRRIFGPVVSRAATATFAVQLLAILAANLSLVRAPWTAAAALGAFVAFAPAAIVARANTLCTAATICGFVGLSALSLAAAGTPIRTPARWVKLLPRRGWAVPLVANTMRFGEAVPVVVGKFGSRRLREARAAVLLGSLMPLALALLYAAASARAPTGAPSAALRGATGLAAAGAVASTVLGCLMAVGQLLRRQDGGESGPWRSLAAAGAVALPAGVAAGAGRDAYLLLLRFAGAIPTVVLYGLLPPLAALHTRRTAAPRADVVPAAALAAVAAGALGVLAVNLSHLVVVC